MGGHVVLPVELFMTNFAGVGVPLEVGRHVVPVEVAGVGVGVIANFTAVGVLWWPFVRAETADAGQDCVAHSLRSVFVESLEISIVVWPHDPDNT